MTRSRSITPEMPAELRAPYVAPVNVGAFEDVFGVDGGEDSATDGVIAPSAGNAPGAPSAPSAGKCISRERRIEQAREMPEIADRLGLDDAEETLALALAAALDVPVRAGPHAGVEGLEQVAEAVVNSRVSREDVQTFAREVGVVRMLTPHVKAGIVRVVVLIHAMEKLGVATFEGKQDGRTLLGYKAIVLKDNDVWRAVLREVVGWLYVKSIGTVYDHILLFGFGGERDKVKFPSSPYTQAEKINGTEKKERALTQAKRLVFKEKTLASNLKRLTNGRTKSTPKPDKLHLLLEAVKSVCDMDNV